MLQLYSTIIQNTVLNRFGRMLPALILGIFLAASALAQLTYSRFRMPPGITTDAAVAGLRTYYEKNQPVNLNGKLLFVMGGFAYNDEVWATDGDSTYRLDAGRQLPWTAPMIEYLLKLDSMRALFIAKDSLAGSELWVTDGTPAGTRMLEVNLTGNADPRYLTILDGGKALFMATPAGAGERLFVTDGTPAGTKPLHRFCQYILPAGNGKAMFTANDSLFITDGTPAGTVFLLPRFSLGNQPYSYGPYTYVVNAWTTLKGFFRTDGTRAGTVRLLALPSADDVRLTNMIGHGPLVYFQRTVFAWQSVTNHLWRTDGTTAGTIQVAEMSYTEKINPTVADGPYFYFAAMNSPTTEAIFRTQGTPATTEAYLTFADSLSRPGSLYMHQDNLYMALEHGNNWSFAHVYHPLTGLRSLRPNLSVSVGSNDERIRYCEFEGNLMLASPSNQPFLARLEGGDSLDVVQCVDTLCLIYHNFAGPFYRVGDKLLFIDVSGAFPNTSYKFLELNGLVTGLKPSAAIPRYRLAIHPNPACGSIQVLDRGKPYTGTATMHGASGQQRQVSVTDGQLNLENLPTGLYYLRTAGGGSAKLVVEK